MMRFPAELCGAALLLLGGCSLAPAYAPPATAPLPATFKEAPGWGVARPADSEPRGSWWQQFNDPVLDALMAKVEVSNQNVAAARAAYDSARALVTTARAGLFPTITASGSGTRSQLSSSTPGSSAPPTVSGRGSRYSLSIGSSWEPDLWGALGNTARSAEASAEASAGDLANATLAARSELATNYVQLRGTDAESALLAHTIADYKRALSIANNQYNAGIIAHSDVFQAETTLHNAEASYKALRQQRALLEHAIAVLVGSNPSSFDLPPATWEPVIPVVPGVLPATLLERRPDIVAAERRVAAANASIGVERAAYFPQITLSAGGETSGSALRDLFSAASNLWSFGVNGLLTLFDFGARHGKVEQARAQHREAVASYRQTVLTAFQQVEDNLAGVHILKEVTVDRRAAASSARKAAAMLGNQYLAGFVAYSDVIVAETSSLSAEQAEIEAVVDQQAAAIALVESIGGDWNTETIAQQGH